MLDLSGCTRYRKRPALTCLAHQLVLGLSFPISGVDGQYSHAKIATVPIIQKLSRSWAGIRTVQRPNLQYLDSTDAQCRTLV